MLIVWVYGSHYQQEPTRTLTCPYDLGKPCVWVYLIPEKGGKLLLNAPIEPLPYPKLIPKSYGSDIFTLVSSNDLDVKLGPMKAPAMRDAPIVTSQPFPPAEFLI